MKTIYLLRHAQADSSGSYDDDHDRKLTKRGFRDSQRLGELLSLTHQIPDQFVTSTAVRARQTVEGLAKGAKELSEVPLRASHALYEAESADVLKVVQSQGQDAQSVLLVGHEPTWSTTVSQFVGAANVSLSPGSCVRIDVPVENWDEVTFGDGTLRWMIPPTLLQDRGAL